MPIRWVCGLFPKPIRDNMHCMAFFRAGHLFITLGIPVYKNSCEVGVGMTLASFPDTTWRITLIFILVAMDIGWDKELL